MLSKLIALSNELFKLLFVGVGLALLFVLLEGIESYSLTKQYVAKERTVQSALLSSNCREFRVQKDSLLARYLRGE